MPYKNQEDQQAYHEKWQAEHKEVTREYKRKQRAANPEHNREYDKEWRMKNPESIKAKNQRYEAKIKGKRKDWRQKIRQQAIQQLGGVCTHCQCSDIRCLQIDHIIPIGRSNGRNNTRLYLEIIEGSTNNLQVLCANCHAIKTYDENNGLS